MCRVTRHGLFPLFVLVGSLILATLSFSGCGPLSSHRLTQCTASRGCPQSQQQSQATTLAITPTQAVTIIETPVSKVPLRAYVIISSSDSLDSGRTVPDGSRLLFRLIPRGKLLDGKTGSPLTFSRMASEDDIGLKNIPPGSYTMQVSGVDARGMGLNICLSYNDDEPAHSQNVALQDGILGIQGQSATTVQLMMCPA